MSRKSIVVFIILLRRVNWTNFCVYTIHIWQLRFSKPCWIYSYEITPVFAVASSPSQAKDALQNTSYNSEVISHRASE
jgi:hypothetical protein